MDTFIRDIGHLVYHYTKFENAIKIISSRSLIFGEFGNMNDIAESRREIFGNIPINKINIELSKYKSISLTKDTSFHRGFSIDPLWGHYADKGNGICIVFDKIKLRSDIKKQFGRTAKMKPIKYLHNFSNAFFSDSMSSQEVEREIMKNANEIFFTKSNDWKYEQEIRILVKGEAKNSYMLHFGLDTIVTAILCMPKYESYKETSEYKILKLISDGKPVLHYTSSLGNKELLNEDGNRVCAILGKDLHLDV